MRQKIIKNLGVMLCLGICFFLWNNLADVGPAARFNRCHRNLDKIYAKLVLYVQKHKKVPTDINGEFSIRPLLTYPTTEDSLCSSRCPGRQGAGDNYSNDYLSNREFVFEMLGTEKEPRPIVCDKPLNHNEKHRKGWINVLYSDGSVRPFKPEQQFDRFKEILTMITKKEELRKKEAALE